MTQPIGMLAKIAKTVGATQAEVADPTAETKRQIVQLQVSMSDESKPGRRPGHHRGQPTFFSDERMKKALTQFPRPGSSANGIARAD
jgi:acyl-CoA synthetase (NDP forming)